MVCRAPGVGIIRPRRIPRIYESCAIYRRTTLFAPSYVRRPTATSTRLQSQFVIFSAEISASCFNRLFVSVETFAWLLESLFASDVICASCFDRLFMSAELLLDSSLTWFDRLVITASKSVWLWRTIRFSTCSVSSE